MIVSIQRIENIVCDFYKIDKSKLSEQNRKQNIVKARAVFFYLSHKFCNLTYQSTGNYVKRNHSTVMYWVAKIGNERQIYSKFDLELLELENKIKLIDFKSPVIQNVDLLAIAVFNTNQQYIY